MKRALVCSLFFVLCASSNGQAENSAVSNRSQLDSSLPSALTKPIGETASDRLVDDAGQQGDDLIPRAGPTEAKRVLNFKSNNKTSWQISLDASNKRIGQFGPSFGIYGFNHAGAYSGAILKATNLGIGEKSSPVIDFLAPYNQIAKRVTHANGVVGDVIATTDEQPAYPLPAGSVSTRSGSKSAVVKWTNCCAERDLLSFGSNNYVSIVGVGVVGGVNVDGVYLVSRADLLDADHFSISLKDAAISDQTSEKAGTITPSFATIGLLIRSGVTTAAKGYPVGIVQYFYADPPANIRSQSGYAGQFHWYATPLDTSQRASWGFSGNESDITNLGADEGWNPDIYKAPRPVTMNWFGPKAFVNSAFPAHMQKGVGHNIDAVYEVYRGSGPEVRVGTYVGYGVQPSALVGQSEDPKRHGGVGALFYGSLIDMKPNPFSVKMGSQSVSVNITSLEGGVKTGDEIYIAGLHSCNGVDFGDAVYPIVSTDGKTSVVVKGRGVASVTGQCGGTGNWGSIQRFVPFAPVDFMGEFRHGIVTEDFKSDDGSIVLTQPGNGLVWKGTTERASINSVETTKSNIDITLSPGGGGVISSEGPLRLKIVTVSRLPTCSPQAAGEMLAVSDAQTPAYNTNLVGGGRSTVPAFCNGSSWTAH